MKNIKLLVLALTFASIASAQRIAVLNDIHVTPGNVNSEKIKDAIAEINADHYECVIVNGDLTNEGSDSELKYIYGQLSGLVHPLYVVPGNHENNWSQSATKTFFDLWSDDRFAFKIDSLVIVGINCGPYMKMGDGHIKQEDLHWLKRTLDEMVLPGDRVLSFNHYPIRKDDIDNYEAYAALLEDYPVIAHVNGHYHKYSTYDIGDIPAVMTRALSVDDTFGYSIVQIDGDTLTVSEKYLMQDPALIYSIPVNTHHAKNFANRDIEIAAPQGWEVTCVHADSASVFMRLAFDADNVYFGTSLGEAKAIAKTDGATRWSVPLGASLFSRPTVVGTPGVAFPHADGITVVDTHTGNPLRIIPTKEGPYVADGLLVNDSTYVQGGYKRIECYDPQSMRRVWSYDSLSNYCQAAPVADGGQLFFGAWDAYLRCIDLSTGELIWRWSNGRSNNLFSPGNVVPVVTDSLVVIVAPDRYMTAIDRFTGETVWRDNSHRFRESLGKSEDGLTVYAKTMDGELVAVDGTRREYTELWLTDMGLGYEHAPCVIAEADGVVFAGSRRGLVTAVDADTHQLLWQLPLGVSEVNGIDVDPYDRSIWASLIEGKIYRIRRQ